MKKFYSTLVSVLRALAKITFRRTFHQYAILLILVIACTFISQNTYAQCVKPNAGVDKAVNCLLSFPGGTTTMSATAISGTGGIWSARAGNPGTATITTATSATTTITTFSAAGTYGFVWTRVTGGCTDTAEIVVTAKPNAGINQTVSCLVSLPGGSATMAATAVAGSVWTAKSTNPGTATITTPSSATTTITNFSAAGTYSFIWTNTAGCTDTADVVVTAKPNAGVDATICQPTTTYTMTAAGTGTWTARPTPANPSVATISTASSPTSNITGLSTVGTYGFIWTSSGCADTVLINVVAKPAAGVNQAVSCLTSFPSGSATMAATAVAGSVWTAKSTNPGTATITTPSSATTTITNFSAAGTYSFIWTNTGGCTDTADVVVTAKPNAGVDATICQPTTTYTMTASGTGTWTARPTPANPSVATISTASSPTSNITGLSTVGTYGFIWTSSGCADTVLINVVAKPAAGVDKTVTCLTTFPSGSATMAATAVAGSSWTAHPSNPGTATITTPSSATTTITNFSAAGTYSFIWTNTGGCTDTANVVVTAKPNAGMDATVCQPTTTYTMTATGTGTWTARPTPANPSVATISTASSPTSNITGLSTVGTYGFIWTSNGCADTVLINVVAKPNAGINQAVSCLTTFPSGSATMAATAVAGSSWTAHPSNPGTATITTPSSATTTITNFSAAGTYSFIWTNTGGCTDTADVVVTAKPNAGADVTVCQFFTATMGATGTGTWTARPTPANPSVATITTPTSNVTTITGLTLAGTYGFIWTAASGCVDTALVIVNSKPDAGVDKTVCQPGTSTTMTAVGTGTWTARVTPANPSVAVITTPTSNVTTITALNIAGTYGFVWTNGSGCTDTVEILVSGKPNAGADVTICKYSTATMGATGLGTWTARAGNPSSSTITTPTSSTTSITGFTASGIYGFVWTNSCGFKDTTHVIVNPKPNAGFDATICQANSSAALTAVGTGTWTAKAGNPSAATITSPSSPTSSVTALTTAGTYSFVWTVASGCTDTADIFVVAKPNAGTDRTGICQNATATMGASGTGSWTSLSTNPAIATITTPTSNVSTITGLTASGTYGFVWTNASGCTDTANVVVVTSPGAGTSGIVDVCSNNSATINLADVIYGQQTGGTWTRLTGTGGTFSAAAGTFIPTKGIINTSTFRYIQTSANGCPADTSIATIGTQDCDTSSKAVTDFLQWARLDFTPANPMINATSYTRTFKSLGNSFTLTASTSGGPARNIYAQIFTDATDYNAFFINNFNMTSSASPFSIFNVYNLKFNDGLKRGVQFIIDDLDNASLGALREGAQIVGYNGATAVTPTVTTNSPNINITTVGAYKQALTTLNGDSSWLREVTMIRVYFAQPIDQIEIKHFNTGGTGAASGGGIDIRAIQLNKSVNPDTGSACNNAASTPIANVIANDSINGHLAALGASVNSSVDYSGIWPSGISLTKSTGAINVASGVATGAYNLKYKSCDTLTAPYGPSCYLVPFTVNVLSPPNAGADKSISVNSTNLGATGIGTWSAAAGNPAIATIVTPTSPTSLVSGLTIAGDYTFNWNNGACVDQMLVRVSGTSLPVKLVSFNIEKLEETAAKLSWITSVEIENDRFEVERSADGKTWAKIGEVKGAGNTTEQQSYTFIDATPMNGTNYYRFKQVDFDGHFEYSKILQATFQNETALSVTNLFPNPAKGNVRIHVSSQSEQEVQLKIMNIQGQLVVDRNWSVLNGENEMDLDITQLSAGLYTVNVISEKQFSSKKLVVQ